MDRKVFRKFQKFVSPNDTPKNLGKIRKNNFGTGKVGNIF